MNDIPPELQVIIGSYYQSPLRKGWINAAIETWTCDEKYGSLMELKDEKYFCILQYGHISDWDTSQVTTMGYLFAHCTKIYENISMWDVSNVTDMTRMFYHNLTFNQPLDNWKG